jgi:hypothetical protein
VKTASITTPGGLGGLGALDPTHSANQDRLKSIGGLEEIIIISMSYSKYAKTANKG